MYSTVTCNLVIKFIIMDYLININTIVLMEIFSQIYSQTKCLMVNDIGGNIITIISMCKTCIVNTFANIWS